MTCHCPFCFKARNHVFFISDVFIHSKISFWFLANLICSLEHFFTLLYIFIVQMLTSFVILTRSSCILSRSAIDTSCVSSASWLCPRHPKWSTIDTVYSVMLLWEDRFFFLFEAFNHAETILHAQSPISRGQGGGERGAPRHSRGFTPLGVGVWFCQVVFLPLQVITLFIFYSAYVSHIGFR